MSPLRGSKAEHFRRQPADCQLVETADGTPQGACNGLPHSVTGTHSDDEHHAACQEPQPHNVCRAASDSLTGTGT